MAMTLQEEADFLLQFFVWRRCPPHEKIITRRFHTLAHAIAGEGKILPLNTETVLALRKLLEAKDCAIRSLKVYPTPEEPGTT